MLQAYCSGHWPVNRHENGLTIGAAVSSLGTAVLVSSSVVIVRCGVDARAWCSKHAGGRLYVGSAPGQQSS